MSETPETRGYSFSELAEKVNADFRARRRFYAKEVIADTAWNGWRLDPGRLVLDLFDSNESHTYEVDLEQCVDSAHILDCLVQVSSKNWSQNGMEKVVTGLLRALNDILHLQAKVCPSGVHKVLTGQQMSELVSVFQQRFHAGEK